MDASGGPVCTLVFSVNFAPESGVQVKRWRSVTSSWTTRPSWTVRPMAP